jgi:pyrimidine operon attenuation protein/uracil phosphoribosyltransferase
MGAVEAPRQVLDAEAIARALRRMAVQITERNGGAARVALVGIRRGGVPLAARLQALLRELEGRAVPVGSVDITLYRDDAATALPNPLIGRSEVNFPVEDHTVILVDDVLYTGRTVRAAIDALLDYGRPRAIQLAVLVDRGHRELPIAPDFVGKKVPTERDERVEVRLQPEAPTDEVLVGRAIP